MINILTNEQIVPYTIEHFVACTTLKEHRKIKCLVRSAKVKAVEIFWYCYAKINTVCIGDQAIRLAC